MACIAGYFLLIDNTDGVFVAAVLGAVSFFLSVRSQSKASVELLNAEREAERDDS